MWDRPAMRAALAVQDIGTVFRLLQAEGYSQAVIASWTGQGQPEVSAILHGRRVISYQVLSRIAEGLGIPRGYLGLAWCTCHEPGRIGAEPATAGLGRPDILESGVVRSGMRW